LLEEEKRLIRKAWKGVIFFKQGSQTRLGAHGSWQSVGDRKGGNGGGEIKLVKDVQVRFEWWEEIKREKREIGGGDATIMSIIHH